MTETSTVARPDDADLRSLVPSTTRWRNALLVAVAVGAVALAWASPALLRPTLGPVDDGLVQIHGGGATSLEEVDQVVVAMNLEPRSVGPLDVVAVDDVVGAEVLGAWIVPYSGTTMSPLWDWAQDGRVEPFGGQSGALPQQVAGPEPALEILWQITDCEKLDPSEGIAVTVQTAYSRTSTSTIAPAWAPGGMMAEDWIDSGVCP